MSAPPKSHTAWQKGSVPPRSHVALRRARALLAGIPKSILPPNSAAAWVDAPTLELVRRPREFLRLTVAGAAALRRERRVLLVFFFAMVMPFDWMEYSCKRAGQVG